MARPVSFVFGVEISLENIFVRIQFQGHKTCEGHVVVQVCAHLGKSLIWFAAIK